MKITRLASLIGSANSGVSCESVRISAFASESVSAKRSAACHPSPSSDRSGLPYTKTRIRGGEFRVSSQSVGGPPPQLRAGDFIQHLPLGVHQLNLQRHRTKGVRRAAQARIVGPNYGLHPVQHAGSQAFPSYEVFSDLQHAAVHGNTVVAGRDYKVRPANQSLLVNFVMVEERAPWRFAGSDPVHRIWLREGAHMFGKDFRIVE